MVRELAERQRENMRGATLAMSAAEVIREAQEQERAAGKPTDPNMTLGNVLQILGR